MGNRKQQAAVIQLQATSKNKQPGESSTKHPAAAGSHKQQGGSSKQPACCLFTACYLLHAACHNLRPYSTLCSWGLRFTRAGGLLCHS